MTTRDARHYYIAPAILAAELTSEIRRHGLRSVVAAAVSEGEQDRTITRRIVSDHQQRSERIEQQRTAFRRASPPIGEFDVTLARRALAVAGLRGGQVDGVLSEAWLLWRRGTIKTLSRNADGTAAEQTIGHYTPQLAVRIAIKRQRSRHRRRNDNSGDVTGVELCAIIRTMGGKDDLQLPSTLTDRQAIVATMLATGETITSTAELLGCSHQAVSECRKAIAAKMTECGMVQ